MHHLDPQQLPPAPSKAEARAPSLAKWFAGAALAVLGIGAGLTYLAPGGGDRISNAEAAQLQQSFAAHGAVSVELVPDDQLQSAINDMQLSRVEADGLRSRLGRGNQWQSVRLARVSVWDSAQQDGDVVEISSAGYKRSVQLMNAPVSIVIPVDATSGAEITGVRDGGGGITLGVQGSATGVQLPVLAPGQSLLVPLAL